MRPIKFRAWDKTKKAFVVPFDFALNGMGNFMIVESNKLQSFNEFNGSVEADRYIIMQYTGLKDRNGKEIFEGDIIESGDFKWVIKWEDNMNDLDIAMIGFSGQTINPDSNWEVIGNIYETPELREVKG